MRGLVYQYIVTVKAKAYTKVKNLTVRVWVGVGGDKTISSPSYGGDGTNVDPPVDDDIYPRT